MDAHTPDDVEFHDWPPHCIAGAPGQRKPPATLLVMVTFPELLRAMVMEVGLALIEKLGVAPVTVSETEVVSTALPEVPVTVMG